jgi:hypothetical protein
MNRLLIWLVSSFAFSGTWSSSRTSMLVSKRAPCPILVSAAVLTPKFKVTNSTSFSPPLLTFLGEVIADNYEGFSVGSICQPLTDINGDSLPDIVCSWKMYNQPTNVNEAPEGQGTSVLLNTGSNWVSAEVRISSRSA